MKLNGKISPGPWCRLEIIHTHLRPTCDIATEAFFHILFTHWQPTGDELFSVENFKIKLKWKLFLVVLKPFKHLKLPATHRWPTAACFHLNFSRSPAPQWKKSWTSFNVSSMSAVGRWWVVGSWNEVFPVKTATSPVSHRWIAGGSPALESYIETRLNRISSLEYTIEGIQKISLGEAVILVIVTKIHAVTMRLIWWWIAACVDYAAFEELEKILKRLENDEKEIILIGDNNCDFKNNKNANSKKLKSIYSEYQLEHWIKRYTRVAITTTERGEQKVSKTLIDHFSSTNPKYIIEADVMEIGMVDHYLIYGIRKINAKRQKENIKESSNPVTWKNMRKYNSVKTWTRLNGKVSLVHTVIIGIVSLGRPWFCTLGCIGFNIRSGHRQLLWWLYSPMRERQTLWHLRQLCPEVGDCGSSAACFLRALFSAANLLLFCSRQIVPFRTCSLQPSRSLANVSQEWTGRSHVFMSLMQTSLKRKDGRPTRRVPRASCPQSISLGSLPSFMRHTWPSQRRRRWRSNEYMLGILVRFRMSWWGTWSCQVMLRMRFKQRMWNVLSLRSW